MFVRDPPLSSVAAATGGTDGDPLEECVNATREPDGFNHYMRQTLAAKQGWEKPKRERQELAVRVVEKMKQHRLLVDSGDDKCFRFYDQMKEDAEKREDGMRTGEYKRAFTLFAEMKDHYGCNPDVGMYNTLMGFCVHTRDEEHAGNLFQEMKERRVQPNVHTYNCLMNVFAESPYDLLAQMYEDMLKQRIKPDLRTHNTLMRAFHWQRVDDYDRCFKFFEDLKHEGIKPDVMTYNILLEMCRERLDYSGGKRGGWWCAQSNRRTKEQQQSGMKAIAVLSLSLFNEMDERDVRPNTFTYNALMGVLARCADPRVFTVFCAMKEDQREEEEDSKRIQALIDNGELQDEEG
eukprot:gene48524-25843_t